MPSPLASLKTSLSPPTCSVCFFLATSQWKPAKNRLVTSNFSTLTALEVQINSNRPLSSFTAPQVFHSPFVCGCVCRAIIHPQVSTSSEGYIKLFMRGSHRSCSCCSKGNISGIVLGSPAPRYLFKQSAATPGNTHKHTHLDHAAVDKSALKGGRLRHGEHEVFVRNEREREK